ncbi:peptidylprolyl isomerase [Actimicrobium sp. CCC2.4]|uniref:peptidylprolyl isomerase n=1 Tax=Actimicrobium sp. CCC2.4 TaxID=3048606 RepID=UPI002AC8F959|nr:peptidylprolyl isomerase [Actimicrobium sp. CCC2.4]MEB0135790.1 peptidylprolyl isomerase [Actimicrobium sp. CCC2.4]WPX33271.1 peptidylprolyl isomerase [Actimicrobium sp. CCC2.4]
MRQANSPVQCLKIAAVLFSLAAGCLQPASAQFSPAGQAAPAPTAARKAEPQVIDSIVAVVNSDVITRLELNGRVALVEARMKQQGSQLPQRALLEKQILERMIVDRAQLQLAADSGIKIDDVMLDRAMARLAEQNKLSMQDFRNQLEREGTPFSRFREEIREEIAMQRIREREVDNKLQITESEVDNYLDAEKNAPQIQPEYNLAQILVRIPENATAEQIAVRRARADDVARQLRSGADFAKLAASYSDSIDALKGGELGWRTADRLPQLFVDAVARLNEGELSAVVKSASGFHILKVVGKRTRSAAGGTVAAAPAVEQTRARHILIKVNTIVTASEALRKLTDLKQRLDNKAATFEELAKLYSNDLSASKGGDLGWIYPGDTVPEFERAMNLLKPGEVSAPIETPFGYHLIEVLERKSQDVSQERKRLSARQALRERKLEEATQDWIRQLRDRAYVEYRLEDK